MNARHLQGKLVYLLLNIFSIQIDAIDANLIC